jgi:hypothetical protein
MGSPGSRVSSLYMGDCFVPVDYLLRWAFVMAPFFYITTVLFYSGFPWFVWAFFFSYTVWALSAGYSLTWAFFFCILGARIPVGFSFINGRFIRGRFPVGFFFFFFFIYSQLVVDTNITLFTVLRYHGFAITCWSCSTSSYLACSLLRSSSFASPLSLLSFLLGVGAVLASVFAVGCRIVLARACV